DAPMLAACVEHMGGPHISLDVRDTKGLGEDEMVTGVAHYATQRIGIAGIYDPNRYVGPFIPGDDTAWSVSSSKKGMEALTATFIHETAHLLHTRLTEKVAAVVEKIGTD